MKEEKQDRPDAELFMGKSSRWNVLVRVPHIKKYIRSLNVWSFLNNFEANLAKKRYLVLGLEGIILSSTIAPPPRRVDHIVQYRASGSLCTHFVRYRPMLHEFLREVAQWYTLVLYTSAEKEFADRVADYLERDEKLFASRFYRSECDYIDGRFLKDLEKVSEDLSSVVFLDYDFGMHKNTLPIDMFTGCPKDRSLLSTAIILDSLRFCSDVRSILELAHL
ncbi:CTD nuclear envelope phosphatase 1 [Nematocida major]|uniref:CTD nuclear envelope phosphatase 1 n=1 Tax=Nematocida major TaxID=1912982 RepID=UPI0020080787|nr:CTD nuclear envelope phosphatase 1 [Nematocida major]KAH9386292.1 CTD nuclear envelope phosphatase 1 [Nematocida major]